MITFILNETQGILGIFVESWTVPNSSNKLDNYTSTRASILQ